MVKQNKQGLSDNAKNVWIMFFFMLISISMILMIGYINSPTDFSVTLKTDKNVKDIMQNVEDIMQMYNITQKVKEEYCYNMYANYWQEFRNVSKECAMDKLQNTNIKSCVQGCYYAFENIAFSENTVQIGDFKKSQCNDWCLK